MPSWRDPGASAPLFFGNPELPLFGVLHPVLGSRTLGVVVCSPLGNDGVAAHRALRLLARRLAESGFPTLRFDPPASGDSAGDDDAHGRIGLWRDSIGVAVEELKARTGVEEVALVGIKLGATIAATSVDAGLEVAALVLWDALPTGERWLREERTYQRLAQQVRATPDNPPPADGGMEAAGFLFKAGALEQLRALDLATGGEPWPAALPVLVDADRGRSKSALVDALASRGAKVDERALPGLALMLEEWDSAAPPLEAIETITAWLGEVATSIARTPAEPAASDGLVTGGVHIDAGIREEPLLVDGEAGRLFGMVCEADDGTAAGQRWAVLFNAGFVRHIGPNRMYVRWARDWAKAHLPSARVDCRNVGESDGADGPYDLVEDVYTPGAVRDGVALVRELQAKRGAGDLVLLGVCSGGFMSLHVALEVPEVRTIVLINPQTLNYDRESTEDRLAAYVGMTMFSVDRWRSVLARKGAARQLRERSLLLARVGLRKARRRLRAAPGGPTEDWLVSALRQLRDSGVAVHFVMSDSDPALAYLERSLGPGLERAPANSLQLHVIEHADHTFRPLGSQQRLRRVLDSVLGMGESAVGSDAVSPGEAPPDIVGQQTHL
jgi:pimeloyl-ACP methyl ester carboxylesterase